MKIGGGRRGGARGVDERPLISAFNLRPLF